MKILLLAGLLLSCIAGLGQPGQDPIRPEATTLSRNGRIHMTKFGLKGGYNRSIINGHASTGASIGYVGNELYGGFFADTELNGKWNFKNELLVSWTDDYHFVEIPLHVKYRFSSRWSAFAGPKLDIIADNDNDPYESNYKFRNFAVSVESGVQYTFTGRFFAEMRYAKGLMNQITDFSFDINNGKRNTFRVGAGVIF